MNRVERKLRNQAEAVVPTGAPVVAAAYLGTPPGGIENENDLVGERTRLARYLRARGLHYQENLLYPYSNGGYALLTPDTLTLTKAPAFGRVKARHVLAEARRDGTRLAWFDVPYRGSLLRLLHLTLPDGRFAANYAQMRHPAGAAPTSEMTETFIAALGEAAEEIPPGEAERLDAPPE